MEDVKKFSRWKKNSKNCFFQMSKKAPKTTYFFCFYSYLGGGWFKPKYGYFFNPSLIDTGSYVRSYETSCLIYLINANKLIGCSWVKFNFTKCNFREHKKETKNNSNPSIGLGHSSISILDCSTFNCISFLLSLWTEI